MKAKVVASPSRVFDKHETLSTTQLKIAELSPNGGRLGFMIYSEKTNTSDIYVRYKTGVSATAKSYAISPGELWVDPINWQGEYYVVAASGAPVIDYSEFL